MKLVDSLTSDVILSGSVDEGIPGIRRMNTTQFSEWVFIFQIQNYFLYEINVNINFRLFLWVFLKTHKV